MRTTSNSVAARMGLAISAFLFSCMGFAQQLDQSSAMLDGEGLRVLLKFGPSGHTIEKVYSLSRVSGRVSPSAGNRVARKVAQRAGESGDRTTSTNDAATQQYKDRTRVWVTWLNVSGEVLMTADVVDPRLAHAPRTSDAGLDYYVKSSGVYLLKAPAESATVQIELPTIRLNGQQLARQQWHLKVPEANN